MSLPRIKYSVNTRLPAVQYVPATYKEYLKALEELKKEYPYPMYSRADWDRILKERGLYPKEYEKLDKEGEEEDRQREREEKEDIQPATGKACGTCYKDAWEYIVKKKTGTLVHGAVQNRPGEPYETHAWVELPNDKIWEPQSNYVYPKDVFMGRFQARELVRYTYDEAVKLGKKTGKYGPWEEKAILPATSNINIYYVPAWKEVRGIFVGGCVQRGPGSSFRAKAHAHNMKENVNFGWICVRSVKRLGETKGNIITKPSQLLWHEYSHILTAGHSHDDVWRNKMRELHQPITAQYVKQARPRLTSSIPEQRWCPRCKQWVKIAPPFMSCPLCGHVTESSHKG